MSPVQGPPPSHLPSGTALWRSPEKIRENLHFGLSLLLALALIPALAWQKLPIRFDWSAYFAAYWVGLAIQSIFLAVLLYLLGFPSRQTIDPFWQRYRSQKLRLLFLVPLGVEFFWLFRPGVSILLFVDALALVELVERLQERQIRFLKTVGTLLVPAAYLFVGLILVFSYSNVLASLRFYGTYDAAFNRMDSWILMGTTVSEIAHSAVRHLPLQVFRWLEFFYFGMFPQIGAGIIFTAFFFGRKRSLQFAGTILTAYYLALLLFYLWPCEGPYYSCPTHFAEFPNQLMVYTIQKYTLANVNAVWEHKPKSQIGLDYFIAFPCMHIAQPLIVMWFLRRWKRILAFLIPLNLVILVSVLLLEWHYVVDVLGGVLVALAAIVAVNGWRKEMPLSAAM